MRKRPILIASTGLGGVDEAGRGALAGPVYAAAVLWPTEVEPIGIDDSKRLSAAQRTIAAEFIRSKAPHAVASVDAATIDAIGIVPATFRAMKDALDALGAVPEAVMVDGSILPQFPGFAMRCEPKADGRYASVAAASILAKTERDALMIQMAETYPEYGFDRHVGYGTADHLQALRRFGASPIHRLSFRGVTDDQTTFRFE